jgi:hypothetical protein
MRLGEGAVVIATLLHHHSSKPTALGWFCRFFGYAVMEKSDQVAVVPCSIGWHQALRDD